MRRTARSHSAATPTSNAAGGRRAVPASASERCNSTVHAHHRKWLPLTRSLTGSFARPLARAVAQLHTLTRFHYLKGPLFSSSFFCAAVSAVHESIAT